MTELLIFFAVLASPLVLVKLIEHWPRSLEGEMAFRLGLYMHDARKRGVATAEAFSELRIRTAFAALRRKASEQALVHPYDADAIIDRIAKEEALRLSHVDKAEARRFAQWVDASPTSEILYWRARKAVERYTRIAAGNIARMTPAPSVDQKLDMLAGMKVLRD